MKAYYAYTTSSTCDNGCTSEFSLGYFMREEDALIACRNEAMLENKRLSRYPNENQFAILANGEWTRRDHMGEEARISWCEIEVKE